jgi:hypothetical protein
MNNEKKEMLELIQLEEKCDAFIQDIFDWVSPLECEQFLFRVYDFKQAVRKKTKELHEQEI